MGLLGKVRHQIIGQLAGQDVIGVVRPPTPPVKKRRLLHEDDEPAFALPEQLPVAFSTDRIRATCGKLIVQLVSEKGQLVFLVTDNKGKTVCQTIVEQP